MILLIFFFFLLGTVFGSFVNVLADRIAARESLSGRSYCDYCRKVLSPYDLVPVLSFVALGGRCRYCRRKLSFQYPLVEALCGVLFALAFTVQLFRGHITVLSLVYAFFLICIMMAVSIVDFKFSLIPTTLVFVGSLVALFYNYFILTSGDFVGYVFSAFVASLAFALIVLVTKGRGMGVGDVILAFLIGMVLGPVSTVLALFGAFFSGALVAVGLLISGKRKFGQAIPFGPFLVLGFFVSFFWANRILGWYLMLY